MSKNIKDIGKKLLGQSLNSFHRKTGLTQLEENNKMQDGILDGILSQVDDAYIEKTEQSNIIHLDGSGDGVVVLDSIEGNTMVNLGSLKKLTIFNSIGNLVANYDGIYYNGNFKNAHYLTSINMQPIETLNMQQGKTYTLIQYQKLNTSIYNDDSVVKRTSGFVFYSESSGSAIHLGKDAFSQSVGVGETKITKTKFTVDTRATHFDLRLFTANLPLASKEVDFSYWFILLEGDYVDKEINYFEGLQSSFEEKVNDEGKYEIEILSHKGRPNELKNSFKELQASPREYMFISITDIAKKYLGKRLVVSGKIKSIGKNGDVRVYSLGEYGVGFSITFNCNTSNYINFVCEGRFTYEANAANGEKCDLSFYGIYDSGIFPCVKDIKIEILDDNDNILATEWCSNYKDDEIHWKNHKKSNKLKLLINEPLRSVGNIKDRLVSKDNKLVVERYCSIREYQEGDLELENTLSDMTNTIYLLDEICYEEVTNEYGEPILLEGYENGTLYIDSTIIPTTTVRYTPKMESFKTYKEVKAKNAINDFDVTNNVIPYMMEVDIKLTELEMGAISTYNIKNIRKMEVLDMISMQERTFKMLERLIRGKSHTKQEMIDRVLLYEQAKRITTEQALELNLVIEEVYGA